MQAVQQVEIDGQDFKKALEGAKDRIEQHIDELNELNVFPVPDGDTGAALRHIHPDRGWCCGCFYGNRTWIQRQSP